MSILTSASLLPALSIHILLTFHLPSPSFTISLYHHLALAQTAACHGASMLNYMEVVQFTYDGPHSTSPGSGDDMIQMGTQSSDQQGKGVVTGVVCVDQLKGTSYSIKAKSVLMCGGPFTGKLPTHGCYSPMTIYDHEEEDEHTNLCNLCFLLFLFIYSSPFHLPSPCLHYAHYNTCETLLQMNCGR